MAQYQVHNNSRYRLRNAFLALTVVRIIRFLLHIFVGALRVVAQLAFKLLRVLGLAAIDLIYGLKVKLVDLKYSGKRQRTRVSITASFFALLVRQITGTFFQLFRRTEGITREGAMRTRQGLKKELHILEKRSDYKPSLLWSTVNFACILCALALPFIGYAEWRRIEPLRQRITFATQSAFADLFSARDRLTSKDITGAHSAFAEAGKNFLSARQEISSINSFLLSSASLIPNDTFRLAASSRHIIAAGELSSRLGQKLTEALTLPAGQEKSTIHFLDNFIIQSHDAIPMAQALENELKQVDAGSLPPQYREQFAQLSGKTSFLTRSIQESLGLAGELENFLGKDMDKRYMLVFQNNAEKRATGGFIGSYAIVDLRRGEITALTVPKGGSYDTEAGLSRLVAAPEPLRLLNPLWHFWDANWWPDWPTSARKLMQFYEDSNGPTVDGIISLTPAVIERILRVIGPIDMKADYGVVINADNFWSVTQAITEQKIDKTNAPKKIIGDLMNKIMAEAPARLTPEKTMQLVTALEGSLNEKEILAYVSEAELEKTINSFGWGGAIARSGGDYLMVVDTNIGGQKTDRVINETISHQAKILPDGSIIDTLTIKRAHSGEKVQLFTGVRNVDWLRVYVPQGSTLISASGFRVPDAQLFEEPQPGWESDPELRAEASATIDGATGTKIYQEQNKTVFANWSMVDPGQTAVIELSYRLPFSLPLPNQPAGILQKFEKLFKNKDSASYSLLIQKQPGAERTDIHSELSGVNRDIVWKHPEGLTLSTNGWDISQPLKTDFFAAVLFK